MPGSYSNLWCSLFNADLALSVAMTTASTVVSALMLPLNLLFYLSLIYNESGAQKVLGVCFWCMLICLFCLSGVTRFFPAQAMSTTTKSCSSDVHHQHAPTTNTAKNST
jgi:predicted Na+-dependent transporter